jgi:hypothetical protein
VGEPRIRHWCNVHRSTYTSIADHIETEHPSWTQEDIEANVTLLDLTGNIPPARVGFGTINDTAAVAVEAGYRTASTAGRFGGLGYRTRRGGRIWGRGR